MKNIIFDFNGTLVNDVDLSLECMNYLIDKYLDRNFLTKDEYRKIFRFPVKDYYKEVGFDFDKLDFKEIGKVWMDHYVENFDKVNLFDGVKEILIDNIEKGYKNIVLSASHKDLLVKQLKHLGIYDYFDEVLGIDNIYAESKAFVGKDFIKRHPNEEAIMIGDTIHDLEVAESIGIKCIIVANGHSDKESFNKENTIIYDDIKELKYV